MKRISDIIVLFYPSTAFAVLFLGLSITELTLFGVQARQYWTHAGIPWHGRAVLMLWSIFSAAAVAWLVYWMASGAAAMGKRWSLTARLVPFVLVLLSTAVIAFYIVSWAYYWRTSMFLDVEAMEFGFRNAPMMWEYLWQSERTSVLLLAVSLAFAVAILSLLWKQYIAARIWDDGPRIEVLRGLLSIAIATHIGSMAVTMYGDPTEKPARVAGWWNKERVGKDFELRYRVSPLVTLVASPLLRPEEKLESDLDPDVLGPPRTVSYEIGEVGPSSEFSVIVVAMESLRADVVMLEHQGQEVTPHLNLLAKNGRWLTRAYAQSSHSNYADPALLSSLYPLRSQKHHYYSRADPWPKTLLYDVLKERGYDTALFSSQNETWGYMDAFLESPNLDVFFDSRSHDGATLISAKDPGFARYATAAKIAGKLNDAITMDQAMEWLAGRPSGRPFCLCMNLQTSHFPYELPSGKTAPFSPSEYDFAVSFANYPEDKVPVVRNAYFNAINYMDQQLGRLVAFLEERGLREKTLLVVAGDNGECFYENGYPTHAGPPFEPAIHVALVMNCPGSLEPASDEYLTQMIDVVPTIVGWLGLPPHPCFQGVDVLAPDKPSAAERAAFIHCCAAIGKADAIVTNSGWKLIIDRRTNARTLFDLNEDPTEQEDLAGTIPEILEELTKLLEEWRQRQLIYYQTPRIHGLFYPPKTPLVASKVLISRSMTGLAPHSETRR